MSRVMQTFEGEYSGPRLRVSWLTDVGQVRDLNEDALFSLTTDFERGSDRQSLGVFIVADGMGGYAQGELASAMAVRAVSDQILRRFVIPVVGGDGNDTPLHELMRNAVIEAHSQLQRDLPGAGTTLTVAVVADESLAIAHVGDSRAYLFRAGVLEQLTQDHSLVARLVETGQETAEEAAHDPRRNVLYRALGQSDALDVDFQFQAFPRGSRLLICSDGLWGQVEADELDRIVRGASDPHTACAELIELANDAGGPDNITAILVIRN